MFATMRTRYTLLLPCLLFALAATAAAQEFNPSRNLPVDVDYWEHGDRMYPEHYYPDYIPPEHRVYITVDPARNWEPERNLPVDNNYHRWYDQKYSDADMKKYGLGGHATGGGISIHVPHSGMPAEPKRNLPVDNNYHRWYDDKYGN